MAVGYFDQAYAMSSNHAAEINTLDPGLPVTVMGVSDPFGSDLKTYLQTAIEMEMVFDMDPMLHKFRRAA